MTEFIFANTRNTNTLELIELRSGHISAFDQRNFPIVYDETNLSDAI